MKKWMWGSVALLAVLLLVNLTVSEMPWDQIPVKLDTVVIDGKTYTDEVTSSRQVVSTAEENGGIFAIKVQVTDFLTKEPIEGAQVVAQVRSGIPERMAVANTGVSPVLISSAATREPQAGSYFTAVTNRGGHSRIDEIDQSLSMYHVEFNAPGYQPDSIEISRLAGVDTILFEALPVHLPSRIPADGSANYIDSKGLDKLNVKVDSPEFKELVIKRLACNGITGYTVDDIVDIDENFALHGEYVTNALVHSSDCDSVVSRNPTYTGQLATAVTFKDDKGDAVVMYFRDGCSNLVEKKPKEQPTPKKPFEVHGKKVVDELGLPFPPSKYGQEVIIRIEELGVEMKVDEDGNFWFMDLDLLGDKKTDTVNLTVCEYFDPKEMRALDPAPDPNNKGRACRVVTVEWGDDKVDVPTFINEIVKFPPKETPRKTEPPKKETPTPKATQPPNFSFGCGDDFNAHGSEDFTRVATFQSLNGPVLWRVKIDGDLYLEPSSKMDRITVQAPEGSHVIAWARLDAGDEWTKACDKWVPVSEQGADPPGPTDTPPPPWPPIDNVPVSTPVPPA